MLKKNFVFFYFSDLRNVVKCMDSMFPWSFLLNTKVVWLYMVFKPPLHYNGELNLKICLNFERDKPLWGELQIYGEYFFITTLSLFHFFRKWQHPEKRSVTFKNLFISECMNPSVFIYSNLLKKSFRKTSLFVLTVTGVMEKKYSVSCIFQTIVVVDVIKILEKYLWRSSVLERNF